MDKVEPVHPSLKHAESPMPRAVVAATTACAVSRVRGPTTAALSNQNAGGKADPDPLPLILAVGQALAGLVRLTSMLALNEGPHLVELHPMFKGFGRKTVLLIGRRARLS